MREQEAAARSEEAAGRSMAARREVSASEYRAVVDRDNVNRQEDVGELVGGLCVSVP
jgi:hypothetical protein